MGVDDILNPIHIRAKDLELAALKRYFGRDLVFWGGGAVTQGVLPNGTPPREVKDDVRRNVEALTPGGGYVFNTNQNLQADVTLENIIAMWEVLQDKERINDSRN